MFTMAGATSIIVQWTAITGKTPVKEGTQVFLGLLLVPPTLAKDISIAMSPF